MASSRKAAKKPAPAAKPAAARKPAPPAKPAAGTKTAPRPAVPAKAVERAAPPRVPEKPVKPAAPVLPIDIEWLAQVKQALLARRQALSSILQSNQNSLASNEGDPSDIADRASDGFEDELTAGLLSIEADQLDEIDEALRRIDFGNYGVCITCEKPIPRKRLDILPFAKRCLKCEGEKERLNRMPLADDDGGADDEPEEEHE